MRHVVALVLFGAGAVLSIAGNANWGLGCVSAGLFTEAL